MKIIEIYRKYLIPENLQMHMLRVAACGKLILDNWNGPNVNKEAVIRILLLHDMGNIVKITSEQNSDVKFLNFRQRYIDKYGEDDHKITDVIAKEVGLTLKEIEIMDAKILKNNLITSEQDLYEIKICAYCDQRVAPNGIKDLEGRLKELQIRHQKQRKGIMSNPEQAKILLDSALEIENQIMQYCTINPNEINDDNILQYIEILKSYEIVKL